MFEKKTESINHNQTKFSFSLGKKQRGEPNSSKPSDPKIRYASDSFTVLSNARMQINSTRRNFSKRHSFALIFIMERSNWSFKCRLGNLIGPSGYFSVFSSFRKGNNMFSSRKLLHVAFGLKAAWITV